MKYAKWIGGGLGWALGGPIGALIGFAIGALFESDDEPRTQRRYSARTGAGDFKMSLLVLIACVIKADGKTRTSELETVRRILMSNFGPVVNGNDKCTDFGNWECTDFGNNNAPISVTTIHNFR